MIYAFRESEHSRILVEFTSPKAFTDYVTVNAVGVNAYTWRRIPADTAHRWVRNGNTHETGLWIDFDGRIRYAKADPDGY
jgi:hypothetical protein